MQIVNGRVLCPHEGWRDARSADYADRIAELEAALGGIIDHWNEFGPMMIENKTDYGLDERIAAAEKLIKR